MEEIIIFKHLHVSWNFGNLITKYTIFYNTVKEKNKFLFDSNKC